MTLWNRHYPHPKPSPTRSVYARQSEGGAFESSPSPE